MKHILLAVMFAASIAGCSGAGSTSGIFGNPAEAWPARWCQAKPGNTREELVAIMGTPTIALDTQMSWSAQPFRFIAFFDPDGIAKQLDINLDSPSDSERAALKCGQTRTRRSVAAAAAAAAAVATPPRKSPRPCAWVSEAEMSAILGVPVVAQANDRSGGKCIYKGTAEMSPYVELSVDRGDGKASMTAMGVMGKYEPGLTSPYQGIGDQAAVVGPALMIRTGEDLITIVFSGVSDAPAKAKHIFETAKTRM